LPDNSWIDAATGHPAQVGPPGWSPITDLHNPDPNHVEFGHHTFVRVPCSPPPQPAEATPSPQIAPFVPSVGFGFGFGGGHGDDRRDRR
jgi:hypothetical protein